MQKNKQKNIKELNYCGPLQMREAEEIEQKQTEGQKQKTFASMSEY